MVKKNIRKTQKYNFYFFTAKTVKTYMKEE